MNPETLEARSVYNAPEPPAWEADKAATGPPYALALTAALFQQAGDCLTYLSSRALSELLNTPEALNAPAAVAVFVHFHPGPAARAFSLSADPAFFTMAGGFRPDLPGAAIGPLFIDLREDDEKPAETPAAAGENDERNPTE